MNESQHSIYSYLEPASYLKDVWEEKKKNNPSFTIRAWAKSMGMKAHNPLYESIKGKRKIPKSYIPLLVNSLSLSPQEGLYFEALIDLQRAKKQEEKQYYSDRLNSLSPKEHITFFELESFRFFKDPTHFALLEMTELKDFKYDMKWIQKKLGVKKTLIEIERMIERLITLGFLQEEKGTIIRTQDHIFSQMDKHDEALKKYHQTVMDYARKALSHQEIDDREYNGVCFNIKKEHIKEIKAEIREFKNKLIAKYEAPKGKAMSTYQLNIQLFNLNKKID